MSRTKGFLFFLLSLFLLSASARAQTRQRQTAARAVEASRFAGPDIGARINAADRSLGAAWARNSYLHLPETELPLAHGQERPVLFESCDANHRCTGVPAAMKRPS